MHHATVASITGERLDALRAAIANTAGLAASLPLVVQALGEPPAGDAERVRSPGAGDARARVRFARRALPRAGAEVAAGDPGLQIDILKQAEDDSERPLPLLPAERESVETVTATLSLLNEEEEESQGLSDDRTVSTLASAAELTGDTESSPGQESSDGASPPVLEKSSAENRRTVETTPAPAEVTKEHTPRPPPARAHPIARPVKDASVVVEPLSDAPLDPAYTLPPETLCWMHSDAILGERKKRSRPPSHEQRRLVRGPRDWDTR
jgi:hypothetical protein